MLVCLSDKKKNLFTCTQKEDVVTICLWQRFPICCHDYFLLGRFRFFIVSYRTKCLTPSTTQPVKSQCIFRSCSTSTFNAMRFDENPSPWCNRTGWLGVKTPTCLLTDENPFTCRCKKPTTKLLKDFKFGTFIDLFQVTSLQWKV